jgi:Raf kinase inhibitor-like YbhB/YbcL family protein
MTTRLAAARVSLSLLLSLCLFACNRAEMATDDPAVSAGPAQEGSMHTVSFSMTSAAFRDGDTIPTRYTGDGEDVSPPLTWPEPPPEAKSFALIADDPDAPRGTWVHWVAYRIPAELRELNEALPKKPEAPNGILQGKNDFGKVGYNGPAPPPGKPHRYFFKLYALDFVPTARPGMTKQELLAAIEGHVIGEAQLMGTYGR